MGTKSNIIISVSFLSHVHKHRDTGKTENFAFYSHKIIRNKAPNMQRPSFLTPSGKETSTARHEFKLNNSFL